MRKKIIVGAVTALAVLLHALPPAGAANPHSETRIWGSCSALVAHSTQNSFFSGYTTTCPSGAANRWIVTEIKDTSNSVSNGATVSAQGATIQFDSQPMGLESVHWWCTAFCGAGTYQTTLY